MVTDNSKSMLNYKDSASVLKDLNTFRTKLKKDFGNQLLIKEITVGTDVKTDVKIGFNESNS